MLAQSLDSARFTDRVVARLPLSVYRGLSPEQRSALAKAVASAESQLSRANAVDIRLAVGPVFFTLVAGRDRRGRRRERMVRRASRKPGNLLLFAALFGVAGLLMFAGAHLA
ncbi:MAG: hypothetical protein ACTSRY_08555 [Alphaproteobacteria bacterium]